MAQPANKKRKTVATDAPTITDPRFANIQSDPRYRLPGKKQKIKLDNRFSRALQDEDFTRRAKVDRYGRPIDTTTEKQRLKRKYDFVEDDDEQSDNPDDDGEVQRELRRVEESRDILREGRDTSSSEEESSSNEDSDVEEDVEEQARPGEQKAEVPMGDVSSRLAVVNLDWDNIRAEDLMVVFNSFLPATGRLVKVAIYPSEFGKERMEREEMEGPPKEIFAGGNDASGDEDEDDSDDDDDDAVKESIIKPDDGSEFDSAALRQYQLDRLRYFYAILTFSSAETAKSIYDAVDGTEYLSTANFFDLRFVPDETDFDSDKPREECEKVPSGYKPNEFVTDALQHSKVKLTWDAEDGGRKEAQARAFSGSRKDIDENDLKAYLGSDSESELDETLNDVGDDEATFVPSKKETERQRMRALLGLSAEPVKKSKKEKDGPVGNIQITFSAGLSGAADESASDEDRDTAKKSKKSKRSVFANSPELEETTMEKYIRKEKERKQRRKEKMKGIAPANDETANQTDDEADEGFNDPFFAEADPSSSKSASKLRKEERLKKRREREEEEAASAKSRTQLELLMADDNDKDDTTSKNPSKPKSTTVKHFDMKEIEKAEKLSSKSSSKHNKHKKSKSSSAETITEDTFKIQTQDPRFTRIYENHEFAIDPTNPRFKSTKGMKALLEEGRKRRGGEHNDNDDDGGSMNKKGDERRENRKEKSERKKKNNNNNNKNNDRVGTGGNGDVAGLIEKIKRRNK